MGNVCFGRHRQDDETPLQNTRTTASSSNSSSRRSSSSGHPDSYSASGQRVEQSSTAATSSSIPEPPPPYTAPGSSTDGASGAYSDNGDPMAGRMNHGERGQSSSMDRAQPPSRGLDGTAVGMDLNAVKRKELDQIQMAKRISLLHHIPTESFHDNGKFENECPICMIDFEEGEKIRSLPCLHTFHLTCIDDWLLRSFTCPSCMEPVDAALLADYTSKLTDFLSDVNLSSLSSSPATVFLPSSSTNPKAASATSQSPPPPTVIDTPTSASASASEQQSTSAHTTSQIDHYLTSSAAPQNSSEQRVDSSCPPTTK